METVVSTAWRIALDQHFSEYPEIESDLLTENFDVKEWIDDCVENRRGIDVWALYDEESIEEVAWLVGNTKQLAQQHLNQLIKQQLTHFMEQK